MKFNKWFVALAMGLAVAACAPKAEEAAAEGEDVDQAPVEKTAKDFVPSRQTVKDVSYLVGINFGSFIKGYNFGDLDYAQIRKGMEDFIHAKGNQRDPEFTDQFRVDPNTMNELFNQFLSDRRNFILYTNKEKEDKFLAANAKKAGVEVSTSGLQYKIISEGNDVKPVGQDTVYVRYQGKLLDGTVFDETKPDGDAAKLLLNRVVKGWQEGLGLIGEGGEIELYVPAKLGYGDNGQPQGGIEPGATLIFNVTLEKVGKKAE
ncbi:MAG: FKBP-type peptidyl-prolyl cis-trans isomerase [Bacteroidales bacterium]|nr:FKBP-type peptidyl-prolyl cis-trans isomerase [Bacteroidales bacterium]